MRKIAAAAPGDTYPLGRNFDDALVLWKIDEADRIRPFPEGEERKRINAAFQDFFDTLKTETTPEGNTRLYSLKKDKRAYYQIPFEEGVKNAIAPAQKKPSAVQFLSDKRRNLFCRLVSPHCR